MSVCTILKTLDEIEFGESNKTKLKLTKALLKAVELLEISTDLLPVPEHRQDDDWRGKEAQVYLAMDAIAEILK